MQDGRLKHAWAQTAQLAYLLAEPNRDSEIRKEPFTPDDFTPYAVARGQRREARGQRPAIDAVAPITALRDVFIDGKWPEVGV